MPTAKICGFWDRNKCLFLSNAIAMIMYTEIVRTINHHHGHLNRRERQQLNRRENAISRSIRHDEHN
ncbi:hypothetical protein [Nostoc sp.]|uniref:hypothetical protein n=1 Tax=Nostoc sp. TaxID=1180 RepID=UPI002FFAB499